MEKMTSSHAANLITAQANGITLCKAIALLDQAHRYLGQANSMKAMDLSAEVKEFIARYRNSFQPENSSICDLAGE